MASPGTFVVAPLWIFERASGTACKIFGILASYGTYADDQYHSCRPSIATLVQRAGLSRATVHRALDELIELQAVTRDRQYTPEGRQMPSVYRLSVEPPSLTSETPTEQQNLTVETGEGLTVETGRVSLVTHNQEPFTQITTPAPSVRPVQLALVEAAPVVGEVVERNLTETQQIVGGWIDRCNAKPPGRIIARVGKTVKQLLDEGIDPAWVKRGLLLWMDKSLDPSTLHSFVNQAMNAGTGDRPMTRGEQRHAKNRSVVEMFRGVSSQDILGGTVATPLAIGGAR